MVSIVYDNARSGTLTAADLAGRETEINSVNPTDNLTPLGVAVWYGRVDSVKLLLRNGAKPDGEAGTRPPLWVASSKTKSNAGRMVQILLSKGANPRLRSVKDKNSTPLLAAVKTGKPPALISALVDAGASPLDANDSGQTAQNVAENTNDHARLQALLPLKDRIKTRIAVLLQLTGLMLFVVAWANNNVKIATGAGGALVAAFAIQKRFSFKGFFDTLIPSVSSSSAESRT